MNREKEIILVTGAGSGIGKLTAETLARKGHTLYAGIRDLRGRNRSKGEALELVAGKENLDLRLLEMDVTDKESVERAVDQVIALSGRIDTLINNAGTFFVGVTEAFTPEEAQKQFDTNFFGALRTNRAVLPHMREAGRGHIVHVSSIVGRVIFPFFGLYAASKFALEALAESYRYELAPLGIDSTIVEPGPYPTDLLDSTVLPGEKARVDGYGELGEIPGKMLASFKELFSGEESPQTDEVARAIANLVETDAGSRPLRTVVSMSDYGVSPINEKALEAQKDILSALGMEEMAAVRKVPANSL